MPKQKKKGTVIFTSILAAVVVALIIVTVCIFVYGKDEGAYAHTHEFSDTYLYNDDYHWRPAVCGHDDLVKDKETHSYVYDSTVAPTCKEQGYDIYRCVCGKTETRNYTETVEHSYENGFCRFCGEKEPSKELVLELDGGGAYYIVKEVNTLEDTDIVIPSVYGEGEVKPVTEIAERAFENSNVTSVIIPKSITKIGNLAFTDCTALKKVTLPKELISIGWSIFVGCTSLEEIEYTGTKAEWKNLVRTTGWSSDLLTDCKITCTDGVIDYFAPQHEFSDTLVYDDNYHWYPATCTHTEMVKDKAPHSYDYARTVEPTCQAQGYDIYECVCGKTEYRNYTATVGHNYVDGFCKFCGAKEPSKELTLELDTSGSYYVVKKAGVLNDTVVIIPSVYGEGEAQKPVLEIAERAFENSNVTSIAIPDSIKKIGSFAFTGCMALEKVTIPKELTTIGQSVFNGCASLEEIEYTGTKAEWQELVQSTAWSGDMKVSCKITCTDGVIIYTPPATPEIPDIPDEKN